MFYSPIKLAFGGVVAWIVIWLLMPVDVVGYLAPGALAYAAVCYVFLAVGTLYARRVQPDNGQQAVQAPWSGPLQTGLFVGTAAIGLFGMGMRLFDRLYLRNAQYGINALEFRDALSTTAVTPVGAIAATLFPFCLIPLLLVLSSRGGTRRAPLMLLAITLFVLPMTESLFQLSRSFLIMTLGIAFAGIVITRYNGNPFSRKLLLISAGGLVLLAIVSTAIFSARIEAGHRRLTDTVYDSAYAQFLQPNNAAREAINSGDGTASLIYESVLPNGMYYLSGAYEMTALWDRPDGQQHAKGQLLFLPFVRAISLLMAPDLLTGFDIQQYLYRDGVFQTFFGPLWVDFGWFGPLVMSILGFITQRLAVAVQRGSYGDLPIYSFLAIVIFFMPVTNLLVNGLGMFCVIAFVGFAIYTRARTPTRALRRAGGVA